MFMYRGTFVGHQHWQKGYNFPKLRYQSPTFKRLGLSHLRAREWFTKKRHEDGVTLVSAIKHRVLFRSFAFMSNFYVILRQFKSVRGLRQRAFNISISTRIWLHVCLKAMHRLVGLFLCCIKNVFNLDDIQNDKALCRHQKAEPDLTTCRIRTHIVLFPFFKGTVRMAMMLVVRLVTCARQGRCDRLA